MALGTGSTQDCGGFILFILVPLTTISTAVHGSLCRLFSTKLSIDGTANSDPQSYSEYE